jgi:hypothetical protein
VLQAETAAAARTAEVQLAAARTWDRQLAAAKEALRAEWAIVEHNASAELAELRDETALLRRVNLLGSLWM